MKKKNDIWDIIKIINGLFSMPMASAMTGFGFFWYFRLFDWNIWVSIIVSLYISALMSRILHKEG